MPVDGGCLAQPHPVQFASNCALTTVSSRALRPRYAADVSTWHSAGHLTCLRLLPPWTNVWSHQAGRFEKLCCSTAWVFPIVEFSVPSDVPTQGVHSSCATKELPMKTVSYTHLTLPTNREV